MRSSSLAWAFGRAMRVLSILALVLLLDRQLAPLVRHPANRIFVEHPTRFWSLRADPGLLELNSLGLQGEEPGPRQPGEYRILTVGDSCTFGYSLARGQSWPSQLETKLRAAGLRARVFNGSVPGYSSYQALDLVREVAPALQPDALVSALFWADSSRDQVSDHQRLPGPSLSRVRRQLWESNLYRLLLGWIKPRVGQDLALNKMSLGGVVPRVPPALTTENLVALAAASGASRAVFLVLPSQAQEIPAEAHVRAVASAAAQVPGGSFLDLNAAWRKRHDASELGRLFMDPIHPNAQGSERIARDVAPLLEVSR